MPVRYADDFIVLVSEPKGAGPDGELARLEKTALAGVLERELGLSLSEDKTLVSPVTETMAFLGHHLRVRKHRDTGQLVPHAVIPKDRSKRLRVTIKRIFSRRTVRSSLSERLQLLNPIIRGWANFYRHAWGAKRVLRYLDHFVWWTIDRWVQKKHPETPMRELYKQYGWRKPRGRMMRWREAREVGEQSQRERTELGLPAAVTRHNEAFEQAIEALLEAARHALEATSDKTPSARSLETLADRVERAQRATQMLQLTLAADAGR
jgi:hypothetical protein